MTLSYDMIVQLTVVCRGSLLVIFWCEWSATFAYGFVEGIVFVHNMLETGLSDKPNKKTANTKRGESGKREIHHIQRGRYGAAIAAAASRP